MQSHLKDITAPKEVEVSISFDSKILWVNVDGRCELRICQIGNLTLTDHRTRARMYEAGRRDEFPT